jgi:isoamylase
MSQLTDVGVVEGTSFPLGATRRADGVNFSVYSKNATAVELLLFHRADDAHPARTISLDSARNRTYF